MAACLGNELLSRFDIPNILQRCQCTKKKYPTQ